jgi:internalin A
MGMKQILLICAVMALVGCGGSKEKVTPETQAKAEPKKPEAVPVVTVTIDNPILEKAIREYLGKPAAELTQADLEKVKALDFSSNKLTSVNGLEKLTQLTMLNLEDNQLTDVKGLENLTKLNGLHLSNNPALTKAQIDELKKALPNCYIGSNPTK